MRIFIIVVTYILLSHTGAWAQSLQEAAAKVDQAVGRVVVVAAELTWHGSGFAVGHASNGRDVYFITNHHVIEDAQKTTVRFGKDEEIFTYSAKVINRSGELDLAILLLTVPADAKHKIQIVPLAGDAPAKGQDVFAVGFPDTSDRLVSESYSPDMMETTLTRGSVSKVSTGPWEGSSRNLEIISHTASINHGNSGGPLFDFCGRVVGVNTRASTKDDVYLSSSSTVTAGFLNSTETPYTKAKGGCDPNSFALNLRAAAPWVIGVLALAGLGLIGYLLFAQKSNENLPIKNRTRSNRKPTGAAALYIHVTGKNGEMEKHALTAAQLRAGVIIGRSSDSDVKIDAQKMSRRHARIKLANRKLSIEDLGSTNGTLVNGDRLSPNDLTQINSNSQITLGGNQISIHQAK